MGISKATPFASPAPWKFEHGNYIAADGMSVALYDAGTAKRVVTAVNSYERAIELLKAARDFIQDNDLQEYTVAYDMTRCDGECLANDITALLEKQS